MWKDTLKGLFDDVCKEAKDACGSVKDACNDLVEKVETSSVGEKMKQTGEDVLETVETIDIGESLKKVGRELKEELMLDNNKTETSATDKEQVVVDVPFTEVETSAEEDTNKESGTEE